MLKELPNKRRKYEFNLAAIKRLRCIRKAKSMHICACIHIATRIFLFSQFHNLKFQNFSERNSIFWIKILILSVFGFSYKPQIHSHIHECIHEFSKIRWRWQKPLFSPLSVIRVRVQFLIVYSFDGNNKPALDETSAYIYIFLAGNAHCVCCHVAK